MFKLVLEKAEESKSKLPTFAASSKKHEEPGGLLSMGSHRVGHD